MSNGEVNLLPLLRAVKGQMISRWALRQYGVTDDMIQAHSDRGEVVVSNVDAFASVMLTDVGEQAIS